MQKMKIFSKISSITAIILIVIVPLLLICDGSVQAFEEKIVSYQPRIVPDGNGGAFVVLTDPNEKYRFIQHMDSAGSFMWEGLGIQTLIPKSNSYDFVSDEDSGVIMLWKDTIEGIEGIYAQKLDSAGENKWEDSGVLVHQRTGGESYVWSIGFSAVPDKNGGAIIIWQNSKDSNTIYAQRIENSGNIAWDANGIVAAQGSYIRNNPMLLPDGVGGVIIVWYEGPAIIDRTCAMRLNNAGNVLWNKNWIYIGFTQSYLNIISDGEEGVIIASNDYESMAILRVDKSGNTVWGENNNKRLEFSGTCYDTQILSDGCNGLFIVWTEKYEENNFNLYAQRIDGSGNLIWGPVPIFNAAWGLWKPRITSDSSGGFIVSWIDWRNDNRYVYAQRVDASGNILWDENGINLCQKYEPIRDYMIYSSGSGAVILGEEGENLEPKLFVLTVDNSGVSTHSDEPSHDTALSEVNEVIETESLTEPSVWNWLLPLIISVGAAVIIIILFRVIILKRKQDNQKEGA